MIYAIGIGRLTRDAELKHTANGLAITKFSIASNEGRKVDGEWKNTAHFYDCIMFGKYGESMVNHLIKGRQFFIKGVLQHNRWEGDDGIKHSKHQVLIETLEFVDSKQKPDNPVSPSEDPTHSRFQDDIPF